MAGWVYRTAAGTGLAFAGLFIWIAGAGSATARVEGSSLWVIIGAALAMGGIAVVFAALHPRRVADLD